MINCLFEEIFLSKVSYNIFTLLWNKEDCTSYFLKWKVKLFVLLLGSHIMAKILVLFFVGCDCLMKTIINLFFKPFLLLNVNEDSWKVKLHNNKNTPCNLLYSEKKITYELHNVKHHIFKQTAHYLFSCPGQLNNWHCLSVALSVGLSQLTIRAYGASKSEPRH